MDKKEKYILFTITALIFNFTVVFAETDESYSIMSTILNSVLSTIAWLGFAIAIGALVFIGIKYAMSAANEKANLKGSFTKYLIGIGLIVFCSTIASAVANIANIDGSNNAEGIVKRGLGIGEKKDDDYIEFPQLDRGSVVKRPTDENGVTVYEQYDLDGNLEYIIEEGKDKYGNKWFYSYKDFNDGSNIKDLKEELISKNVIQNHIKGKEKFEIGELTGSVGMSTDKFTEYSYKIPIYEKGVQNNNSRYEINVTDWADGLKYVNVGLYDTDGKKAGSVVIRYQDGEIVSSQLYDSKDRVIEGKTLEDIEKTFYKGGIGAFNNR